MHMLECEAVYTDEEIEYAADHSGINYQKNANEAAEHYKNFYDEDAREVKRDLEMHGFTDDEITYALREAGF